MPSILAQPWLGQASGLILQLHCLLDEMFYHSLWGSVFRYLILFLSSPTCALTTCALTTARQEGAPMQMVLSTYQRPSRVTVCFS